MIKELSFMEYAKFTIRHPIHWYWYGALLNPFFRLYLLVNEYLNNKVKGYFINNKLVGCIIYSKKYQRVDYLFVIRKYRNQGIASKLINECNVVSVMFSKQAKPFWLDHGFNVQVNHNILVRFL